MKFFLLFCVFISSCLASYNKTLGVEYAATWWDSVRFYCSDQLLIVSRPIMTAILPMMIAVHGAIGVKKVVVILRMEATVLTSSLNVYCMVDTLIW